MSLAQRERSEAPTMASDFAWSVLTAERNRPSPLAATVAPDTSRSRPCMHFSLGPRRRRVKAAGQLLQHLCVANRGWSKQVRYTDGIALSAGSHWPISVGGQGTAMK